MADSEFWKLVAGGSSPSLPTKCGMSWCRSDNGADCKPAIREFESHLRLERTTSNVSDDWWNVNTCVL